MQQPGGVSFYVKHCRHSFYGLGKYNSESNKLLVAQGWLYRYSALVPANFWVKASLAILAYVRHVLVRRRAEVYNNSEPVFYSSGHPCSATIEKWLRRTKPLYYIIDLVIIVLHLNQIVSQRCQDLL